MAFPTTGILDDFNRSDEGPPPSANWGDDPYNADEPGLEVVSNQVRGSAWELCSSYWSAGMFGEDSEVYVTVVDLPYDNTEIGLGCRIQNPDSATINGYFLDIVHYTSDSDEWRLYRIVNDVWTVLGSMVEQNLAAGNKIGLEAIGGTIKGYLYSGGSWNEIISRTDSNVTGAGYVALTIQNADRDCDDFGGGTVGGIIPIVDYLRRRRA